MTGEHVPAPRWIVRIFWHAAEAARQAVDLLMPSVDSIFAGDNLITFGKSLSFAHDERFRAALDRMGADERIEKALAWRRYTLYWAARTALSVPGDFVEAGCTGNGPRLVCDLLDFGNLDRHYWLYDVFTHWEGDETTARAVDHHSNDLEEKVRARFSDLPNVRIVAGKVPASFERGAPDRIALLHIDLNNVEAERGTLEALYERVSPGGLILFDDYGWRHYWPQKVAADAFAEARGRMILELPTGQGLLIR